MFNEKNITDALSFLDEIFKDVSETSAFCSNANHEISFHNRPTEDIAQALMANVVTVFQFDYSSPNLQYSAKDLFGTRACFLMDRLLEYDDAEETTERHLELWLLEDTHIAVVECFSANDGISNVSHRSIRSFVEDAEDLEFDSREYYHQLECMYQDWERSCRKICRF